MFRIRLADGEEAVYRTVDELALGLGSGIVTPAAEYFQPSSQEWLPLASHPDFGTATARAATLAPSAPSLEDAAPPALVPTAIPGDRRSGPFQIYQMFSQSAAELQARRRPRWFLPAISVTAAAVMVASVAMTLKPPPRPVAPGPAAPAGSPPPAQPRAASLARPGAGPVDMDAVRYAPVNLAAHRSRLIEASSQGLADSARRLGLLHLFTPGRLGSTDSIATTRRALSALRPLLAAHRQVVRRTDAVYRDSAAALVRAGLWSRVDEQEWRIRVGPLDAEKDISRADTLLATMETLFRLLEDRAGQYQLQDNGIRFSQPGDGPTYDRLRSTILQEAGRGPGAWDRPFPLVALLVDRLDEQALPARVTQ